MSARNSRAAKVGRRALRAYHAGLRCGSCTGGYRDAGPAGPGVYHDAGCPVLAGAVDPGADARRAAAEATERTGVPVIHSSFTRLAEERSHGTRTPHPQGPLTTAIISRFTARMQAGPMQICPHIATSAPVGRGNPVSWIAWRPDRLMCATCRTAEQQRVIGTREDTTCDHCGRQGKPDTPGGSSMYAVVVERDHVTLHFGLCPPCFSEDRSA